MGSHTLRFLMAPLVHWPEVMVTYDVEHKILFSADAFGNFGALNGNLYADEVDFKKDWLDEARRYYINIVGRHGRNVQNLFKKLDTLEIDMICSLHGHIYRTPEDVSMMIEKYRTWSAFEPERSGVVLVYSTMYGNTELVMNIMASKLAAKGIQDIPDVRCGSDRFLLHHPSLPPELSYYLWDPKLQHHSLSNHGCLHQGITPYQLPKPEGWLSL